MSKSSSANHSKKINTTIPLYENLKYTMCVPETIASNCFYIYINGETPKFQMYKGEIIFDNARIFNEIIGFAQIQIVVQNMTGEMQTYCSDYYHILMQKDEKYLSIKKMMEYIHINQELLLDDKQNDHLCKPMGMAEKWLNEISSQIQLFDAIYQEYMNNNRAFKVNSKSKMTNVLQVNSFEKLTHLKPATLQYLASHPEELVRTNSSNAIHINKCSYIPKKTLISSNKQSYDIYENRIVCGFLDSVIRAINQSESKIMTMMKQMDNQHCFDGEIEDAYVLSSELVANGTGLGLYTYQRDLMDYKVKFQKLQRLYQSTFGLKDKDIYTVDKIPTSSLIFRSVLHYQNIYGVIVKWFKCGQDPFEKDMFVFPFLKSSKVYEHYVLTKMIRFFGTYVQKSFTKEKIVYGLPQGCLYENTNTTNKFTFIRDDIGLTLYFQPVIYGNLPYDREGILLFKNTTFNSSDFKYNNDYYTPDYVVKIHDLTTEQTKYIILDAKFSSIKTVKEYHVKELCFKYLFSLSPLYDTDCIVNLAIINGRKDQEMNDQTKNMNDIAEDMNINVTPSMSLVTMTETPDGIEPTHDDLLRQYFSQFVSMLEIDRREFCW